MNNNPRPHIFDKYDELVMRAKAHIASLPPDNPFSHLDVRTPTSTKTSHPSDGSANVMALVMPMTISQPTRLSLSGVAAVVSAMVSDGITPADIDQCISGMEKVHYCDDLPEFTKHILIELLDGYYPGRYPFTDTGFRDLVYKFFSNRVRYCYDEDIMYAYVAGVWIADKTDIEGMIEKLIEAMRAVYECFDPETLIKFNKWQTSLERNGVPSSTAKRLKTNPEIKIVKDDFDSDPMLLNLKNYTYNLKEDRVKLHTTSHHLKLIAPVEYKPNADCPVFENMISDMFDGDQGTMEYMQRLLGYCLCGDTLEKRFWVFYGKTGNNGKTTLLNVMKNVLGMSDTGYYATMTKETLKSKTTDPKRVGIAALERKPRLVTVDELAKGFCMNAEIMKEITGAGTALAQKLFHNPSPITITFKLVIASNYLPTFDSLDQSIISRMTVIPFNHSFALNASLNDSWMKELSGILNWLIKGYRMYTPGCLANLPTAVKKATDDATLSVDPLDIFLTEFTVKDTSSRMKVGDFHSKYKDWCTDTNRLHAIITKDMSTPLRNKGYEVKSKSNVDGAGGVPVVFGLKWKDPSIIPSA